VTGSVAARCFLIAALCGLWGCMPATPEPAQSGIGQLRLGALLGDTGDAGYARADRVRPFEFPLDHGPHPRFRSEWWYLTVMLKNEFGAEFGVQFTVFRQALSPAAEPDNPWRTPQVYMAHAAVTAVREQRHWSAQRLARAHPRLAGATAAPLRLWVDGWQLRSRDGSFAHQRLEVAADAFEVALDIDVVKAPVLEGDHGRSAKGPDQASYYYSVPRLTARGTLRIGEVVHQVHGSAWIDHEWSTSMLSAGQVGWDWFALQLDDATELMVFRLRRADGRRDRYDQGMRVNAAGAGTTLGVADFELDPEIYWRDEHGVSWPLQWRLQLPDRVLRIRAAVPDQRMDTVLVYWEGLVGVFTESGERIGRGYMELTGYDT